MLVCRLDVLDPAERRRSAALRRSLLAAAVERRPLAGGLALRWAADVPLAHVVEWIALERRCCPFFRFRLEVDGDAGPVWLRLTGPPGVDAVLARVAESASEPE